MSRLAAMIIDDEPDLLALLTAVLENERYMVHGTSTAWRLLDDPPTPEPSVILLDMMMPEMSGITVAKQLRGSCCPTAPLIALSAAPTMLQQGDKSDLFAACTQKPFELDDLLAVMKLDGV